MLVRSDMPQKCVKSFRIAMILPSSSSVPRLQIYPSRISPEDGSNVQRSGEIPFGLNFVQPIATAGSG